jgi:hypothetical protein
MRLQLAHVVTVSALAATVSLAATRAARADGVIEERTVYYKESATRVEEPMLDGTFDVGARGVLTAHMLVDAVTSASAGVGAFNGVPFSKARFEAGAGYVRELDGPTGQSFLDHIRVGGDGKVSTENDYRSAYIGARAEASLAQQNATVGLGGGVSIDSLDNSGAQSPLGGPLLQCKGDTTAESKSCPVHAYFGSLSLSQIVSKHALVAATYDVTRMDGFLANPYRQVITSGGFFPEKHPFTRLRQAMAVSARYYLPYTQTTFIVAYRFYHDDWQINAHTPELRIVQEVGDNADASLRYRYYTQTASFFAPSAYGGRYPDPTMDTNLRYYTDDPKMTAFTGHTVEAKLGVYGREFELPGMWRNARFEGVLAYIIQNNRYGNAVEAQFAVTVPFDY